ncbi:DNA replication and repair protein RecF [Candidatus Gullanella endobia]|uniref:DNA replication and repair protein RecF n=1 Tax=Candidatus Gullanella endobia TaxID=1070130 RepID=A0A143WR29_9ENTR|nr:DNA replication/repair protein RecF [Candidatus Gullanella endobia]CUX96160.1 DNA replication and repair protein RecF [Candidatus Gullanella endobia]
MVLSYLLIRNFRNIAAADLSLSANFNFFIGSNGSGKTNILEAIYILGHGRAFRSAQFERVIRYKQPECVLHGRIKSSSIHTRTTSIGILRNRLGDSTVRVDGNNIYKMAELAKLLPIQLITSEGFTLLNGGPKYRRAFMDWGCFHNEPDFFTTWSNLRRLLKQRNTILRQVSQYQQLRAWDREIIPLANRITQWRAEYSSKLIAGITTICEQFLPEFHLDFSFQQGWDKKIDFGELLERQFERDRALTYTGSGPHKADLQIRIEGMPVEYILSRGQLKLLICALRLAQGEFFTYRNGLQCLYLIDDFASELDTRHRCLLANRLKATNAQVFVSAISADQIYDITNKKGKIFEVEQGKISFQYKV